MRFYFPIVIIDEDFRSENTSGSGIRDPRSTRTTRYTLDAILMVAGGPSPSPFDPRFDPMAIPRVQVVGNALEQLLDRLEATGTRYVAGR